MTSDQPQAETKPDEPPIDPKYVDLAWKRLVFVNQKYKPHWDKSPEWTTAELVQLATMLEIGDRLHASLEFSNLKLDQLAAEVETIRGRVG